MLYWLHYISIRTKHQQLIQIQVLCVSEISYWLKRAFPMQFFLPTSICVYQNPDGDYLLFSFHI